MVKLNHNAPCRVLLLDEDRILLQSLSQFLAREGYEVASVDDPGAALARLETDHFELLLADINMPGIDPGDFLKQLRKTSPHVVPIVITGYGSIGGAVAAIKQGVFDYMTKPIIDDELRVVVERAARQQALLFENETLRHQLDLRYGLENIIGHDYKMLRIFDLVDAVADSRTTVLMTGDSGTGKSLLAKAIHRRSPRRDQPFVEVSCGALPETLLESELFGHVAGAFTGAVADKRGRFEMADGGTLFLDEINSAPASMQVKLLRVLQERQFEPVGSSETRSVDVRVILATNADLATLVEEGGFRRDLYYRINVVNIRIPPLAERRSDIPLLAKHFLDKLREETSREVLGFTEQAIAAMQRFDWPGNVRELENAIEHAVVLSRRPHLDVGDLPEQVTRRNGRATSPDAVASADDLYSDPMPLVDALEGPERAIIHAALRRNAYNRQATADELAINRTTLYKKMRKYRLDVADAE